MRPQLITFIVLLPYFLSSQEEGHNSIADFVFTPEVMVGIPARPNHDYDNHGLQTQAILNFGWEHDNNPQEWAHRLNGPRSGLSFSYTTLGNKDKLGEAYTIMPFFEFNAFRKQQLKIQVGMGGSYFNKPYDSISNPNNRVIVTDLTLSFRAFLQYHLITGDILDWRVGGGYFHHSNGHSYLPNQGLNTLFAGFSADIKNSKRSNKTNAVFPVKEFDKSIFNYMAFRFGYGGNVLSEAFNDTKGVYGFSGEYGKVFNNTYKLGVGFYYRFYQNYYDYIVDNEVLVQDGEEFDFYKDNPWRYATNIGLFVKGEVLLNHIGIEGQLGINLHKPSYKIAWRIAEGQSDLPKDFTDYSLLGEFSTIYRLKSLISSRLGMKYYLIGTNKAPINDLYFAVHINANLGQADYTEFTLGYVHNFYFKE